MNTVGRMSNRGKINPFAFIYTLFRQTINLQCMMFINDLVILQPRDLTELTIQCSCNSTHAQKHTGNCHGRLVFQRLTLRTERDHGGLSDFKILAGSISVDEQLPFFRLWGKYLLSFVIPWAMVFDILKMDVVWIWFQFKK